MKATSLLASSHIVPWLVVMADAALAFAPRSSSFVPAARRTASACSARLRASPLAMSWQTIYSDDFERDYYWNEATGETSWDKPAVVLSAPAPAMPTAAKGVGTVLVLAENKAHSAFRQPECPNRVAAMLNLLRKNGILAKCDVLDIRDATEDELLTVHTVEHVRAVLDGSPLNDGSLFFHKKNDVSSAAARLAAGGNLEATAAVLEGRAENGFCATRPPGHHAEANQMMGFCIFNNVAMAAVMAKQKYGKKRVLILDWDVHHGNGIQSAFYDDPEVLFISLHRGGVDHHGGKEHLFYPGSGTVNEVGSGAGAGFNINIPIALAGSGDLVYEMAMQRLVLPIARAYKPDFVLISAGFDAAAGDPLGEMEVSPAMFGRMCRQMMHVADEFAQGRIVLSLEGGYNCQATAECGSECVKALLREQGVGDPNLSAKTGWQQAAVDSFEKFSRECAQVYRAYWPIPEF